MKKLLPAFIFLALSSGISFAASETAAGKVVLVKPASKQVLVAFKKEGALVEAISTFKVTKETKLANVNNLAQLKINDNVTIVYRNEAGSLILESLERKPRETGNPS